MEEMKYNRYLSVQGLCRQAYGVLCVAILIIATTVVHYASSTSSSDSHPDATNYEQR
ncbi:hypothetical protein Sjap_013908 [Stephania japonica]|uniref:Uncharacterized protein n=1 Tax=Stephania japonica TaxID=461633 RepID=A0AAP0J1C6_9MAGN